MAQTIKCKNCGEEIEVSEALTHQLEEQIIDSLKSQHKKDIEEASKKAEEIATKKVAEDLSEARERGRKLTEQVSELLEETRKLRRKDEDREIEMKKKLLDEEEKIRKDALKKAEEESRFEILELKKQIEDYKEANKKLSQKSQQLQGEVLELDLEKRLRQEFVYDDISEVGKGKQGADIVQVVRNNTGKEAGMILWETKRAKWNPTKWLPKLREDGRKQGATVVVLVTDPMPKDIQNFALINGVIVVSYSNAISLATLLRRSVMLIASAKSAALNKDENLELLYQYLQSDTFRHRFEAFAEGISEQQNEIDKERAAMERIWKRREIQNKKLMMNVSRMYGELQGIMGESLPEIKTLELPDGE